MIRKLTLVSAFLLIISSLFSQDLPQAYRAYCQKHPEGPPLNHQDSLYLMNLPEKSFPVELRSEPLPPVVDNSHLPYLRPVFIQGGASCGQSAMIGYNYTYEMDYLRNVSADVPENQYPTHFTWNFENGGNGWYGVSYFHSLELLRLCGTMNVADYGGMEDDGYRWITGYDNYYNGMYNRIRGFYSIHTGTADGILQLKHWLYNHMGEGAYGGVASYYANPPWNAILLNDTTPEGGKNVVTGFYPAATHAMTIVGYNDSIRYDYNNDGQYTNDIDLNYDGIIDPRDWEIGGVKFVNSYGIDDCDSGFCYMMYKCLAETFENGGVWNRAVHILDINPDYAPLVTYKVTLKHDKRGMIKVMAGISADTSSAWPEFTMDFPMFNYQGDAHYMQGHDTAESQKYIEFGLDVSPLLSYIAPGQPVKFFLVVDENDPANEGAGEIISFSLMDYTSGATEIPANGLPVNMNNDERTMATVIHSTSFDKVEITTGLLPALQEDDPYSVQLEAQGGLAPYSWDLGYNYIVGESTGNFPETSANQVMPNLYDDTLVAVPLGFGFPFYGKTYDTVYVHIDGHLQFDRMQLPWPYINDYNLHLRSNRIIAPMTHEYFTIHEADGDGAWYEISGDTAIFRWQLSWSEEPLITEMNFAVKLTADGNIEFIYGPSTLEEVRWIGGISAGNKTDYIMSPVSGQPSFQEGKTISFLPQDFPAGIDLDETGLLTATPVADSNIYDLSVRVKDQYNITATKDLQLSSGPLLFFTVHAGGDDRIDFGETVLLDLEVMNNGPDTLHNIMVTLEEEDAFISLITGYANTPDLAPGQSFNLSSAFTFTVSLNVPDQHVILMNASLAATEGNWLRKLNFSAFAPRLEITDVVINDGGNGILDPGESAPADITLVNTGHASIDGVSGQLYSTDPEVQVTGNPVQSFGTVGMGASVTRTYDLFAEESTPNGFTANLALDLSSSQGIETTDSIILRIGRIPVLIVDMDPNSHSGPALVDAMQQLDVISDFQDHLPNNLDNYQSIFVCLGYFYSNHILTWNEGNTLEDYLQNHEGRVYMEGRKTWKDDPATPVHDNFHLIPAGSITTFDTITGIDTAFTGDLRLLNTAYYPFSFYWMEPLPPAFSILQDNDLHKSCAVAYDAGTYRTIGALFEYGTLTDLPPFTRLNLMMKYLEFFGVDFTLTGVSHSTMDRTEIVVFPNPACIQLTIAPSLTPSPNWGRAGVGAQIVDLQGRVVKEYSGIPSLPYTLDISYLNPGFYILRICFEDGSCSTSRIIKASK